MKTDIPSTWTCGVFRSNQSGTSFGADTLAETIAQAAYVIAYDVIECGRTDLTIKIEERCAECGGDGKKMHFRKGARIAHKTTPCKVCKGVGVLQSSTAPLDRLSAESLAALRARTAVA